MANDRQSQTDLLDELHTLRERIAELDAAVAQHSEIEAALKRSEQTLRLVFENAFDGISIYEEFSGTGKRRLLDCNERYAEMAGRSKEELLRLGDLAPIQKNLGPARTTNENWRLRREQISYTGRFSWIRPDGKENIIEYSATPIQLGEIALTVGVDRDITGQIQAQHALQEYSERLEEMVGERTKALEETQEQLLRKEKLAAIGQLSGGIGHELRNPLGVISSAAYMLRSILPDADERVRAYLSLISEEAESATKIVNDLMDFARTRPAQREETDVASLIAHVLERHPPSQDVQVSVETATDLPIAFVDPQQIALVLGNLISNAYQAMPDGGTLTIGAQTGNGTIVLSVRDTGCGIPEEDRDRLFEPLFTTKSRGIGLGLATSKSLIEANGGGIEVESQEGRGSAFTITLPTKGAAPGPARISTTSGSPP
jgi:PAS domain S-box-containing protein